MTDPSKAPPQWFEDIPVLGRMPPEQAIAKLAELGERVPLDAPAASGAEQTYGLGDFFNRGARYTAHVFGYIDPNSARSELVPVHHASNIDPDRSLKNARIKLSLGRLAVADYPGGGNHLVLFDFCGRHQAAKQMHDLHYNLLVRATQGQRAGVLNHPIFVGLKVGGEGVQLRCYTVNIKNEDDEALLQFLDSDVFQAGLKLVNVAQPALAPLSKMAYGLTRGLAKRHRNVPVQDFRLGLDFTRQPFGACLREGAYVAVQVPSQFQSTWDWNDWVYSPATAEMVERRAPTATIPYNYVVFTVARSEED